MTYLEAKNAILENAIKDSRHLLIEISEGDAENFVAEAYARLILARLEGALKNAQEL
jgi:hypothetical protein